MSEKLVTTFLAGLMKRRRMTKKDKDRFYKFLKNRGAPLDDIEIVDCVMDDMIEGKDINPEDAKTVLHILWGIK